MQEPSTHPAILSTITIARSLGEPHFQHLLTALENESLPLNASVLHVQHQLHVPPAVSRSIASLLRQWQTWGKDAPALVIALQTARATSTAIQAESPSVHLVWTGPISLPGPTRTTSGVLLDLIDHARQEIIIVGYTLTETASQIIEHLARAQQRGVQVILILNRLEEELPLQVLRNCWPPTRNWPHLYTRKASISDPMSALHAKAIIVDNRSLLTTSANLSYHGLVGNIELGLLVEGHVAQEAVTLLKALITEAICVEVDVEDRS